MNRGACTNGTVHAAPDPKGFPKPLGSHRVRHEHAPVAFQQPDRLAQSRLLEGGQVDVEPVAEVLAQCPDKDVEGPVLGRSELFPPFYSFLTFAGVCGIMNAQGQAEQERC